MRSIVALAPVCALAAVASLCACGHPPSAQEPRNEAPITRAPIDAQVDASADESDDVEPDADLGHSTTARVVKLERVDTTSLITLDAGNEDGVRKEFVVRFIDDADVPVGPPCILIRVDKHTTVCKVENAPPASARVRLAPP